MPMPELLIERIDDPIYTKTYNLKGTLFEGHEVHLYAECDMNYEFNEDQENYYNLRFFFDADGYGARAFVIGVSFGEHELSQEDIDAEVMTWIKNPIHEYVLEQLDGYLKKEKLYEEWSEAHEND